MTNTTETTEKRLPTHLIHLVTPMPNGKKSKWSRVAAVWQNKDGNSFNIVPDQPIIPGAQYVMMKYEPKP